MFNLFVNRSSTTLIALTHDCGQLFAYVDRTSSDFSERRSIPFECLFYRSAHALARQKKLSPRCRSLRLRLSSEQSLWRVRIPIHAKIHKVPFDRGFVERDVAHGETSSDERIEAGAHVENVDPSTLPSCPAVTHSPLDTIAVLPELRVRVCFPWKQKKRELLVPYPERSVTLLS